MKKQNEVTLKEALQELIGAYRLEEKLDDVKVLEAWKNTLGTMINKHTTSLKITRGKLLVKLDSAPLKQELMMSKTKLIEALNREVGKDVVREIVIT